MVKLALASPGRRPAATSSPLERWIASYRRKWPHADQWAAGTIAVSHTAETQDRVFRMVEQLVRHGSILIPSRIFDALGRVDHLVTPEAPERAIAKAGCQAYAWISGHKPQPLRPLRHTRGVPVPTVCRELGRLGHEPIVFDGRDPAAYAWAIFETAQRLASLKERVGAVAGNPPVALPFAVAVTPARPLTGETRGARQGARPR